MAPTKKNRRRGAASKNQPGSSAAASHPLSSPPPPTQPQPPPPTPPTAARIMGPPPPRRVGYLSGAEKEIFWRVVMSAFGDGDGDASESIKHLKVAPLSLEEIDGRALLGHYLSLVSDSLQKTIRYIMTSKNMLEKKKEEVFTPGLHMNLFITSLGDQQATFDCYEKMTKLLLKKAKYDRDRLTEGGASSSSAAAGGASGGEPFNS